MATSNPTANWGGPRSRPASAATASTYGVAVKHETDLQPGAAIHGERGSPENPSPSCAAAVAQKRKAGSAKPPPTSPPTPRATTGPTGEFNARVAATTTTTTTPKTHSTKGAKTAPAAATVEQKGVSAAGLAVRLDADASAVRSRLEAAMVGQNVASKWRKMGAAAASPSSPKPIGRQQQQQQRQKIEARGAQSRAVERRQLELDVSKEIVGALARVVIVRTAIRDKLLPMLDACDVLAADAKAADRKGAREDEEGDEGKEGDDDGGAEASGGTDDDAAEAVGTAVSPLSATTLAEFVPLREFCTACWFVEPTTVSDERHARERAAARLSNKMRGLGVTRLVAHPTVSRCIALRESKQTVHTRWCTLGDAIRIAAVGPSCPARYPECESLVKQLERAAKSRAVVAFLAARAAETERLDGGGGGGGGEGGADTQEGTTNTGDAAFFIPLSLFADVPRTPRGAAVKPPQEQHRRRNLQELFEIDDRARNSDSLASASSSSSSPSLAADDDTDTEPEDNGGNRARRSDSPKKKDGVQDGGLRVAAKSADRGPTQRLKRRDPRQGRGDDDDDDGDDDDRVAIDPNPVAVTATIANKGPARMPAVAVANRGVKKTSVVAAAVAVAVASPSTSVREREDDKPVKREKKRRTIESEEPTENKDADSSATSIAAIATHRAAAIPTHVRAPLNLGALTLSELEEQIKRSALIVQIAQNNALINEANRRAETSGGSRIVDAFM